MGWISTLQVWAQIVAPLIAAVAAVASWRSAKASLRTAARSDETSRRAVEALGRASKPLLRVRIDTPSAMSQHSGPIDVALDVQNDGANRGLLLSGKLTRTDGFTLAASIPPHTVISSTAVVYDPSWAMELKLGKMPRLIPNPIQSEDSSIAIDVEITYSDLAQIVTWSQRSRWIERVQMNPSGTATYSYLIDEQHEPVIIGVPPDIEPRPVGWVRRKWRHRRVGWVRRKWQAFW